MAKAKKNTATEEDSKRSGSYVRLSEEQFTALEEYIGELNVKRAAAGLRNMRLSTWLRELGLKHSGNEHLGAAAQALKEAEAAQVL